ncbi:hypothetical protein [Micromonospora sp. NPDC049301]|uniref:fibronectin type III domain-containing protein n=1 Tax=Micromonospora sp. NPDC049301 TaxID=3155723 RepID=UPI003441492A
MSDWSPVADPTPTAPTASGYPEPVPTPPDPAAPGPFASPGPTYPASGPVIEQHPSQDLHPAQQYNPGHEVYPAQQYHPGQVVYPAQQYHPGQVVYPVQHYHPGQDGYRPAYTDEGSTGRSRATLIGAAVAAGVAVVAVAGLGAVVLNRDDAPPPTGTAPTAAASTAAAGPPPGDLKLRDDSVTITLTWTDPSQGAVPFMVAGGRAGQALGVMATVDPGRTSYTVNGLNSRVDYCFTVLAVYSTDSFATSGQVCTERDRATPPS